jgi:hypothetical protein
MCLAGSALAGERINAMNQTTDNLDRTDEETLACEVSDEDLEALAVDTVRRAWTRVTTSCGGANC